MPGKGIDLLTTDPMPAVLGSGDPALTYFARRDLLDWQSEPVEALWELPDMQVSPAYCNCSKAFVRVYWTPMFERPVEVDPLEMTITGSVECRFRVII